MNTDIDFARVAFALALAVLFAAVAYRIGYDAGHRDGWWRCASQLDAVS